MINQTYFISTGAKSAMHTLNVVRISDDPNVNRFMRSHFIRNLSAAGDDRLALAIEKAEEYVEAMRERIGETDEFKVVFGGVWDEATQVRRGRLSALDSARMDTVEAGMFPFGKHSGVKFDDAPEGYVLFWADKFGHANGEVAEAVAAACQGVALERGYIARRDEIRAERNALDSLSTHVGEVGDRLTFEGEVVSCRYKRYFEDVADDGYWIYKVRCGTDLVTYMGSKSLGQRGQTIKFKATVKRHSEFRGVKETLVNRPHFVS